MRWDRADQRSFGMERPVRLSTESLEAPPTEHPWLSTRAIVRTIWKDESTRHRGHRGRYCRSVTSARTRTEVGVLRPKSKPPGCTRVRLTRQPFLRPACVPAITRRPQSIWLDCCWRLRPCRSLHSSPRSIPRPMTMMSMMNATDAAMADRTGCPAPETGGYQDLAAYRARLPCSWGSLSEAASGRSVRGRSPARRRWL